MQIFVPIMTGVKITKLNESDCVNCEGLFKTPECKRAAQKMKKTKKQKQKNKNT